MDTVKQLSSNYYYYIFFLRQHEKEKPQVLPQPETFLKDHPNSRDSLWDILTPWLELYCNSLPCLQSCFLLMLLTDAIPEVSLRPLLHRSLWPSLFPDNPHSDVFCAGRGQQGQRSDPQTVFFTREMSVRRKADNFFLRQNSYVRESTTEKNRCYSTLTARMQISILEARKCESSEETEEYQIKSLVPASSVFMADHSSLTLGNTDILDFIIQNINHFYQQQVPIFHKGK